VDALITILPGDGIGPEVAAAGVQVLEHVATRFGHRFDLPGALIGGAAIDAVGDPLPADTITQCRQSDAILLGAVGGPRWSDPNATVRPEQGLLRIRAELEVFANLRPVSVYPELAGASPLKSALLENVDMIVWREKTGRHKCQRSLCISQARNRTNSPGRCDARCEPAPKTLLCRQGKRAGNIETLARRYRQHDGRRIPGHRT